MGTTNNLLPQNANNFTNIVNTLNQINLALGALNKTLTNINLNVTGIASSAGSSSGKYLSIIGPDGNPYKIALLDP